MESSSSSHQEISNDDNYAQIRAQEQNLWPYSIKFFVLPHGTHVTSMPQYQFDVVLMCTTRHLRMQHGL
jgi:hypothetical protein